MTSLIELVNGSQASYVRRDTIGASQFQLGGILKTPATWLNPSRGRSYRTLDLGRWRVVCRTTFFHKHDSPYVIENSIWLPGGHLVFSNSINFIQDQLETKTNRCVKFHDYTMSGFSGVARKTKKFTDKVTDGRRTKNKKLTCERG